MPFPIIGSADVFYIHYISIESEDHLNESEANWYQIKTQIKTTEVGHVAWYGHYKNHMSGLKLHNQPEFP